MFIAARVRWAAMGTRARTVRTVCGIVIILVAFLVFTYAPDYGWWVALTGSALIIAGGKVAWPTAWRQWLGLDFGRREACCAAMVLVATAGVALALIFAIASAAALRYDALWAQRGDRVHYLHNAAQTLNEEMVLGALLLGTMRRALRGRSWLAIAILAAAVFSAMHFAFYACRVVGDWNHGHLSALTLASLFLVGVIRNTLILRTGHIAYAWALHLGWNAIFFGGGFYNRAGWPLNEPDRFNQFLGSPLLFGLLVVALTAMAWWDASANRKATHTGATLRAAAGA